MSRKKNSQAVFDKLIGDLCAMDGDQMLDACINYHTSQMSRIPVRYRIIALGFAAGYSLDELNNKLDEMHCARLYTRSFWEATLVYAFRNGLDYAKWKELREQCKDLLEMQNPSAWFREKKITYDELERYVYEGSDPERQALYTRMQTRYLDEALVNIKTVLDFRQFVSSNLDSFCEAREKTRYYFCKYLYFFLNQKIENYLAACRTGRGIEESLAELSVLKVGTELRRSRSMPEEQKRQLIRQAAISCGEIFDAFNYYYFNYVSLDWVDVQLEAYGSADMIPECVLTKIADVLRKTEKQTDGLSDAELVNRKIQDQEEDALYSKSGEKKGYQKNRVGENTLRKYIRGELDIDRTTLLSLLMFFAAETTLPKEQALTKARMEDILRRCGYAPLDLDDDFDWFVLECLEGDDRATFVTELITEYAMRNENSFLYHMYGNSVSYRQELESVLL